MPASVTWFHASETERRVGIRGRPESPHDHVTEEACVREPLRIFSGSFTLRFRRFVYDGTPAVQTRDLALNIRGIAYARVGSQRRLPIC